MADSREYTVFFHNPFKVREIKSVPFRIRESYYFMQYSDFNFTQDKKYLVVDIEDAEGFSDNINNDRCIITFLNDKGERSRWFAHKAIRYFAITKEDIIGHLEARRLQAEQTVQHAKEDLQPLFIKTDGLIKSIVDAEQEINRIEEARKNYNL